MNPEELLTKLSARGAIAIDAKHAGFDGNGTAAADAGYLRRHRLRIRVGPTLSNTDVDWLLWQDERPRGVILRHTPVNLRMTR